MDGAALARVGVANPVEVLAREAALLEIVRSHPGASTVEIIRAAEGSRGATADRLRRLAARGAIERIAGRWRVAREDEPGQPKSEPVAPEPEPAARSGWIKTISAYERKETTPEEGSRYG